MKLHKFENHDMKGEFATFELDECISKVVVTPRTPSLSFLQEYSIEADVYTRTK